MPILNYPVGFKGRPHSDVPFGGHLDRLVANPEDLVGRDVFVYRNLHREAWSLRAASGPDKGRVVGHADELLLGNARFVVSEAGRQRVLRQKKKNVHAGIRGRVLAVGPESRQRFKRRNAVPVTYNPFKTAFFIHAETGRPLKSAHQVLMDIKPPDGKYVLARQVTYQVGSHRQSA